MLGIKALAVWFVMVVAMCCNGAARDVLFSSRFGEHRANQLSVLTGCAVLLLIAATFRKWLNIQSASSAWIVGLIWLALTLAFEFLFFHYVAGHSWEKLLNEYNISAGRLWPFTLLVVLLAPHFARWLETRH